MRFLKENKAFLPVLLLLPFAMTSLDGAVLRWVRHVRRPDSQLLPWLKAADNVISFLSNGLTLVVIALVLIAVGYRYSRPLCVTGKALLIGFFSAGIVVQALKHLIGRARPRVTDAVIFIGPNLRGGYDSFPSGHAAASFCFAYVLSRHIPRYRGLIFLAAVLASFERVSNTAHFLSDIIAGGAVGILTGKILFAYFLPPSLQGESAGKGAAAEETSPR